MTRPRARVTDADVDAVLSACRCLVALSVRSLSVIDGEVEPAQFRALVVVASREAVSLGELAESTGISLSTASRLCERLVAQGLLDRTDDPSDRRQLALRLTPAGQKLVDAVTDARRADLLPVLQRLTRRQRDELVRALTAFAEGCETAEDDRSLWSIGWVTESV
ncbi:MAG: MarR family winged helix-turn-helix transcriptional regulator [Jatrophihabitans sp.]|uniref:MarR family winged helix-turn-helix transcriptional regulator n=1 Tax=Jatrophihabitans sp. TaxID=1932789 RepID=UPI003F7E2A35